MTEDQREQLIDKLQAQPIASLCRAYIQLRDTIKQRQDELDKELESSKLCMDLIESLMLAELDRQNIDSIATPSGTCYRKTLASYKVVDRAAFFSWAVDNQVTHALDIRAAKSAVDEIVTETGEVPPGLNRSAIRKVNFRRSTNQ